VEYHVPLALASHVEYLPAVRQVEVDVIVGRTGGRRLGDADSGARRISEAGTASGGQADAGIHRDAAPRALGDGAFSTSFLVGSGFSGIPLRFAESVDS
jgi:hypothetical protein